MKNIPLDIKCYVFNLLTSCMTLSLMKTPELSASPQNLILFLRFLVYKTLNQFADRRGKVLIFADRIFVWDVLPRLGLL